MQVSPSVPRTASSRCYSGLLTEATLQMRRAVGHVLVAERVSAALF